MTNNELTLDQLTAIAGGSAFMKIGDIKGEYHEQTPDNSKEQRFCTGYCLLQQIDMNSDYRQEVPDVSFLEKLTSKSVPCWTEF